jgi:hypothetical protein
MGGALAAIAAVAVVATTSTAVHAVQTSDLVARPLASSVVLRTAPRGKAIVRVGPKSVFGGPLVLGVVAVYGKWLEVTSEALANGSYGWVERGTDVSVHPDRWVLHAILSRHELLVLHDGRVVRTIAIATGAVASPTPTGRFAIAEKLPGSRFGSVYGCCILGLTAHQPQPPAGWSPNVAYFVAIHGGGGIGAAVSAGCLHADEADLRYLMRVVPLGTAVTISR